MDNKIRVGKIVNTHGVKGTVKILPLTDDLERFEELEYVFTEIDNKKRFFTNIRFNKGMVFVDLDSVKDMNEALKLKESYIYIKEDQLKTLPEDTFYIYELEGLEVFSTEGELIGIIDQVFQTGANDVYEVKNKAKTCYIPAIKDVVKEIDIKSNKMIINVIEGLFE